jgi:hypothetical protein
MRADRAILGLHGLAVLLALIAALAWPRAGQAAVLVPLGSEGQAAAIRWASREGAPLLGIDPASGRVVARMASTASMIRALGAGIVPIAARAETCGAGKQS